MSDTLLGPERSGGLLVSLPWFVWGVGVVGAVFLFLAMLWSSLVGVVGGVGLLVEIWIVDASIFVAAAHVAGPFGVGGVCGVCFVVLCW
jgi:hypothetical protein